MKKLDSKLEQVYSFITEFIDTNSYPPTVRDICHGLNISSTSMAYAYIDKLVQRGLLEKRPNQKRSLSLTNIRRKSNSIPLVGTVSAGQGILAVENIEDYLTIPDNYFKGDSLFLLRVKGDSMIDVGIFNGDLVVVNKQDYAHDGEIALVMFNESATIKRYYNVGNKIILRPENQLMQDIELDSSYEIQILGIVVGSLKTFC